MLDRLPNECIDIIASFLPGTGIGAVHTLSMLSHSIVVSEEEIKICRFRSSVQLMVRYGQLQLEYEAFVLKRYGVESDKESGLNFYKMHDMSMRDKIQYLRKNIHDMLVLLWTEHLSSSRIHFLSEEIIESMYDYVESRTHTTDRVFSTLDPSGGGSGSDYVVMPMTFGTRINTEHKEKLSGYFGQPCIDVKHHSQKHHNRKHRKEGRYTGDRTHRRNHTQHHNKIPIPNKNTRKTQRPKQLRR